MVDTNKQICTNMYKIYISRISRDVRYKLIYSWVVDAVTKVYLLYLVVYVHDISYVFISVKLKYIKLSFLFISI